MHFQSNLNLENQHQKTKRQTLPSIEFAEGSAPKSLPEETLGALMTLPQLKAAGDDAGDKDNGVIHR